MNTRGLDYQAHWKQHVDSYRNGSLTKKNYCKMHKLKHHQFGYWLKKFKPTTDLVPVRVKRVSESTEALAPLEERTAVLCTLRLQQGCLQVHDLKSLSVILSLLGSNAV